MKQILGVELSHQKAPLAIREGLSLDKEQYFVALTDLKNQFEECFLISTCNRLSLYAYSDTIEELTAFFQRFGSIDPYLTILDSTSSATRHLFSTTSGLESQAIGEHEILGQIKNSYSFALELNAVGSIFNEFVKRAIHTGKRVRKETSIGMYPVSLASVSMDVLKDSYKDLNGINWLILGTGEMSTIILKLIAKKSREKLFIASRTPERATMAAKQNNGTAVSMDQIKEILPEIDVVIGCTHADSPILYKADLNVLPADKYMTFIDLGLPRNFDVHIKSIRNYKLFDLDDLKSLTYEGLRKRQDEIPKAIQIINEELVEFENWMQTRTIAPIISEYYSMLQKITDEEFNWILPKMGNLDEQQKKVLKEALGRIGRRLSGKPIENLKNFAINQEVSSNKVDTFKEIFEL